MSKLISTFKIGFDDETKAALNALKDNLDAITGAMGVPSSLLGSTNPNGGLLVAMSEAANDAPESELKQMGQWVFEGLDERWKFAAVDGCTGRAYVYEQKPHFFHGRNYWRIHDGKQLVIGNGYDTSDWKNSLIERETVNDVDYLSETTSEINVMEASDIIIDEMGRDYSHSSNCLSAVVPQITQADMQLIFIKNLSECLIQRMHSMDRFSDDGHSVFCNEFKAWDIVVNKANDKPHYAVVCGFGVINSDEVAQKISLIKVTPWDSRDGHCQGGEWAIFGQKSNWRTITEVELLAFRCALEACYV